MPNASSYSGVQSGSALEWLISKRRSLESPREYWDSWWQELGDFVMPRKAQITEDQKFPGDNKSEELYDSTAVQANLTLGQGQLSLVTPMEENWFTLEPPKEVSHIPEVRRWYAHCTEVMRIELAQSNFYSEIMETFLDRSGFGTCLMSLEESYSERTVLNFRSHNIGTYSIEENNEGYIDTVFSTRKMSARQIAMEFGEDNLPSKVRTNNLDPKKMHDPAFQVHTAVFPRGSAPGEDRVQTSPFWWDMKYSSYHWVENPEPAMLREGGYASNPFFCSRYLKWGEDPYGWCPGWAALPEARQLNYLERLLDTLVETQVFPRLLVPANMVDEVDMNPGGVTVFNQFQQSAKPEEWGQKGRYDVGLDRAQRKEKKIEEAYHVDLFKMFAKMDGSGQMTAREVAERSSEKIIQFSPTFARMTTELLTPILRRTFHIMNARSKFLPPPLSAVQQDQQGAFVPFPQVIFVSKLAMAIKTMQNTSFMSLMEAVTPLITADPTTMRFINTERTFQGLAKNFGVPHTWLSTQEEVDQSEQAMAQQAQQEEAMGAAQMAGQVPPEMIDKLGSALQGAS